MFSKANNFELDLKDLDESQLAAVTSAEENVVIRASAGSGKTKSLISAIANYRYEHINDRICAITYTRAARSEMEERLKNMGIFDVEVTTIHVWARNQLEFFADHYDFLINILQESQIKKILKNEIVPQYLLKSKVKSVNIDILYTYITGSKNMDISDNYRRTLNAIETRYIDYKRNQHLYDFTDYPLYLYDVLTIYNENINTIDALFVDEFQDVDETQFKIFEKVNTNKKFFIGDPWQSIFVFRGADGEVFSKLDKFKQYKLKYNYRSYQEIIDYATTVYDTLKKDVEIEEENPNGFYISEINWSDPSSVICDRKYGGSVTVVNPYSVSWIFTDTNKTYVASTLEFNNIMTSNPMILCRTNKQVREIQSCGYINASTVHQAKGLEYDNVIVIDCDIKSMEDLNIAYVAMTRAKNNLFVINWSQFELLFKNWLEG